MPVTGFVGGLKLSHALTHQKEDKHLQMAIGPGRRPLNRFALKGRERKRIAHQLTYLEALPHAPIPLGREREKRKGSIVHYIKSLFFLSPALRPDKVLNS